METVGEYVTHVSTQLNDQRYGRAFTRWGRALLLEYLNLGLSEIGIYRPEAFAATREITLSPGIEQTLEDGVSLRSISSNVGGPPVTEGDFTMARAFMTYDICPPSPKFVNGNPVFFIRSFAVDKDNPKKFYVEPAVPAGLTVRVNATILGETPQYTLADWGKDIAMEIKFANNLIDYMMAKAYRLDKESPESRANSDSLFRTFYTSMGVKYKQESKYRADKYLAKDKEVGAE